MLETLASLRENRVPPWRHASGRIGLILNFSSADMFSHVTIGVNDFERALAFYASVMLPLGHQLKFSEAERGWAAWCRPDADGPLFIVGRPQDGKHATHGNGQMVAFETDHRDLVDRCFEAAMAAGGSSEGLPGLRPQYHPNYYGAYFRDPEGNKMCVCCHVATD